jgi:hypothetical protein
LKNCENQSFYQITPLTDGQAIVPRRVINNKRSRMTIKEKEWPDIEGSKGRKHIFSCYHSMEMAQLQIYYFQFLFWNEQYMPDCIHFLNRKNIQEYTKKFGYRLTMGKIGGFRRDWFQEPFVIKTLTCLRWRKI